MDNKDFINASFFEGLPTEEKLAQFVAEHWRPLGCQWLMQRSEELTVKLVELSIDRTPEAAAETLQVVLNDLMIEATGRTAVEENGIIGPDVLRCIDQLVSKDPEAISVIVDEL